MIFIQVTNPSALLRKGLGRTGTGEASGFVGEAVEALVDDQVAAKLGPALRAEGVEAQITTGVREVPAMSRLVLFGLGLAAGAGAVYLLTR